MFIALCPLLAFLFVAWLFLNGIQRQLRGVSKDVDDAKVILAEMKEICGSARDRLNAVLKDNAASLNNDDSNAG